MANDRITVVVPIYKVESILPRCLDSIAGQTCRDLEIILVDDGSPDRSGEICDAYAARDPRMRVIHQKNAGVSAARIRGAREAVNEYIQFVDSDDWLDPDACRILRESADADGVDLVVSGIRNLVTRSGGEVSRAEWIPPREGHFDITEFLRLLYLGHGGPMNLVCMPHGKLYRKSLIVRHNLDFPAGMHPNEDSIFNLAYANVCRRVALVGRPFYNYMTELAPGRVSAVQKYNPRELDDYVWFCRDFQRIMEERLGGAELVQRNAGSASILIAALVRFCRRDATLSDAAIRARLREAASDPAVQGYFKDYRPAKGQSRLIPFFMKARLIRPLLAAARRRADRRYGEMYKKTAENRDG